MLSPSDEYFLDISAGDPVELPGTPYNHHIDDEDKISIETISPIEYATFYDYRSEQKSANLLNLDHDKGALDIRVYMDGPIPTETDTLTIKVSCTDPNLTDVILKKAMLPPEYVFDNIPETIQPGDSVKLEIFYPIDDDLEPFPEDQNYIIKIYKGAEYGRIYSEAEGEDGEEFTEVPGPFYFIANDSIPDSSAIVRIRMEDVYELLPCSIKPDSGITLKDNNISSGVKSSGNIKLTMPNLKNAVAGAAAEDPDYWPWFGAVEIKIGEIDSLDHFEVKIIPDTLASQDTLAFTESAKLIVKAKDKDSVDIDLNENTLLKFTVLSNPQYGTFINKDGDTLTTTPVVLNDVRYGDAKTGTIKFAAVKANPDSVVRCLIKVTMKNDSTKKGKREAVVLEQKLKIITEGNLEVEPIITGEKWDTRSTAYLNNIFANNRLEFNIKIIRGSKIIGGHRFKLSTDYIDDSGGHDHTNPRRPNVGNDANQTERIKRQNYGSFFSYRSGAVFNTAQIHSTIEENSIADSLLQYEYIASIWGDTMRVYLESKTNTLLKDSIDIVERIADLVLLTDNSENYDLIGGTPEHHGPPLYIADNENHNHYGRQAMIDAIESIAEAFNMLYEDILEINDMSLPYGGKFGVDTNHPWAGSHQYHREGRHVDIRSHNMSGDYYIDANRNGVYDPNPQTNPDEELIGDEDGDGQYDPGQKQVFADFCIRFGAIHILLEYPMQNREHWHLTF